jgi:hypothetical protein
MMERLKRVKERESRICEMHVLELRHVDMEEAAGLTDFDASSFVLSPTCC